MPLTSCSCQRTRDNPLQPTSTRFSKVRVAQATQPGECRGAAAPPSPQRPWKLLAGRAARRRTREPCVSPPPTRTLLLAPPPPRTPGGGDMTAGRAALGRLPPRRPPPVPPRPPLTLGNERRGAANRRAGAGDQRRGVGRAQHGRGQHEVALGSGQAALAEGVQAGQQLGRPALYVLVAHGASVQQVEPGRLASALRVGALPTLGLVLPAWRRRGPPGGRRRSRRGRRRRLLHSHLHCPAPAAAAAAAGEGGARSPPAAAAPDDLLLTGRSGDSREREGGRAGPKKPPQAPGIRLPGGKAGRRGSVSGDRPLHTGGSAPSASPTAVALVESAQTALASQLFLSSPRPTSGSAPALALSQQLRPRQGARRPIAAAPGQGAGPGEAREAPTAAAGGWEAGASSPRPAPQNPRTATSDWPFVCA